MPRRFGLEPAAHFQHLEGVTMSTWSILMGGADFRKGEIRK
jgi:hypothetical protein